MSLGFEREKDRQPQARARLAPGRQTFIKFLNPLVYLPLARDGPAVENPPARGPERKVVLGADRNDRVGIRSRVLWAAAEDIHHAAGMTNGVGNRKRIGRRLGACLRLGRDRSRLIDISEMPQRPAQIAQGGRSDVLTVEVFGLRVLLRVV